ncbi:MAG: hypothetical protein R3A44_21190 [Caldilineaceae bacterium]
MKNLILCGLFFGLLTGCTMPQPTSEKNTAPIGHDEATSVDASQPAITAADYSITPLIFAGQGDTFLEAIGRALREGEAPVLHRYVEIGDDTAGLWQGEALHYAEKTTLFLQPVQSGSAQAVQVEIDAAEPDLRSADLLAALASARPESAEKTGAPDVEILFVRARLSGDNAWSFDVRLNHPDTGWTDYVDGWHVEAPNGEIWGTRILLHPHDTEMPFSRSLSGVAIPADVGAVSIRTHDLISGYSADILELPLDEAVATEQYEIVR